MSTRRRLSRPLFGGWNPRRVPLNLNFELDTGHRLSNGLVAIYLPGLNFGDLVFPQNPVFARPAASGFASTPLGPGWSSPASVSGSLIATGLPTRLQSQNYTIIWYGRTNAASGTADNAIFGIGAAASPWARASSFFAANTGTLYSNNSYGGAYQTTGAGSVTGASFLNYGHLACTYTSGNQLIYVSGVLWGQGTYTGALSFITATDNISFGDTRAGTGIVSVYGLIYNRVMSLDEITHQFLVPFDMLRPITRRSYFLPSSGVVTPPPRRPLLVVPA